MFEGGLGDLLLQVIVALKTQFAVRLDQQFLEVRLVRAVAGGALPVFHRLMFDLGRRHLLLNILMTFQAQLSIRLQQQFLVVGLVRIVTGSAFAVLDRLMLYLGFSELKLDVVAVRTELSVRFCQQFCELGFVRLVAGSAFPVFDRLMLHLGRLELLIENVVTIETEFSVRLYEQPLLARGVGIMAGKAFTILGRLVFTFALGHRRVVTIEAQCFPGLNQQLFIGGLVWFVAALAIPGFDRLMLDLHGSQEIFVAIPTKFRRLLFQALAEARLVARGAFLLGERGMGIVTRLGRHHGRRVGGLAGGQIGLRAGNGGRNLVGDRMFWRHSVEKRRQPLSLRRRIAAASRGRPAPISARGSRIHGESSGAPPEFFLSR